MSAITIFRQLPSLCRHGNLPMWFCGGHCKWYYFEWLFALPYTAMKHWHRKVPHLHRNRIAQTCDDNSAPLIVIVLSQLSSDRRIREKMQSQAFAICLSNNRFLANWRSLRWPSFIAITNDIAPDTSIVAISKQQDSAGIT